MKVLFKYGIGAFSGTINDAVYSMTKNQTGSYLRKWVKPRLTSNNTLFGTIAKNLAAIWADVSTDYKADMDSYVDIWNTEHNDPNNPFSPRMTSFGCWIRMLYLFSDLNEGHIDLATVTYSDLQTVGEDILSIAVAIQNGFMDNVTGGDTFTANM